MPNCTILGKMQWEKLKTDSGYCIHDVKILKIESNESEHELYPGIRLTCVGNNLPDYQIPFIYTGTLINHPKYGMQLKVETFQESVSKEKNGIISYLGCGIIKGIGRVLAERIYDAFGNDTLEILDKEPERLREIKGISAAKAEKIAESYFESKGSKEAIMRLTPYNVSASMISKICSTFKSKVVEVIENDTYELLQVQGLGFKKVDAIAKANNQPFDSPKRIRGAITAALEYNEHCGNCGCLKDDLWKLTIQILGFPSVDPQKINQISNQMISEREVIVAKADGQTLIFRPITYATETKLAKAIVNHTNILCSSHYDMDAEFDFCHEKYGFALHEQQYEAIRQTLQNTFTVVTGGPGTGKTTVLNWVCEIYARNNPDKHILLLAPTGRAARKMFESTGLPSQTIHSALGITDSAETTDIDEKLVLDAGLIVVDEMSMTDLWVMDKLMQSISDETQLALVGDVNQLPSVECGNVLHDIIESGICPVVMLTKIFRQAGDSNICLNSLKMQKGNTELEYGDDYIFHEQCNPSDIATTLLQSYVTEAKAIGIENTVCLIPTKEGPYGVFEMNKKIQEAINPLAFGEPEISHGRYQYRIGDVVMHLRNSTEISNGDVGRITNIGKNDTGKFIDVIYFEDTESSYEHRYYSPDFNELTLAYAMTVHKSQGSEYLTVITCLAEKPTVMVKRNLIYTAITRAKKKLICVGQLSAVQKAIRTAGACRYTLLVEKIMYYDRYLQTIQMQTNPFLSDEEKNLA